MAQEPCIIVLLRERTKSYYQNMGLEFRYGFGKVLGTQNHPTHGSTSSHCVLHLNLITGMSNIVFYTYTYSNIHLSIQHDINHPKTLTYIYHGITYHILAYIYHTCHFISSKAVSKSQQQIYMAKIQTWKDLSKHVIASTHQEQLIQASMFIFIIKHISHACSCKCMTYLTYLAASQQLCINGWTCKCMFIISKQENKK